MRELNNLRHISTTKGDSGTSKNFSNESFLKSDILFDLLGGMDELSSALGIAYHYSSYKEAIQEIQQTLQTINSVVATTKEETLERLPRITVDDIEKIEAFEQALLDKKGLEPKFVLPGSDTTLEGAYIDLARSITRRVERIFVRFVQEKGREDLVHELKYLNRLSDLLFIIARSVA